MTSTTSQIGCITPGAFDSLHYLKSLNLMANPFVCNCHMGWFADWLRNKGFHSNAPRCTEPQHLKDKAISSLALHDFRCTGRIYTVKLETFIESQADHCRN